MVKFYTKALLSIFFISAVAFTAKAQLTVQGGQTPQNLVQNVLVGSGVAVSNINFVGDPQQIGSFVGTGSNINVPSGIIISTGNITTAPGLASDFSSGNLGLPGDGDLDGISSSATEDAAILTFDFIPINDTVVFNYVFASEEYPEFVNAGYNDVFAFFISGPGFPTPTNIALLPGTSTPVTIDNVNIGQNSTYYVDNTGGTTVSYDAFTVKLQALAIVQPCSTYTLKIAIADAGDAAYDSAVFLEAGSFTAGNSNFVLTASAGANVNDSLIIEGCLNGELAITRTGFLADTSVVHYTIGGTATNGVDYALIPDSVVFYPNDTVELIPIDAFFDGLPEGAETVTFTLVQNIICVNVPPQTVTIVINNVDTIQSIIPPTITTSPCTAVDLVGGGTGGFGPYTYAWTTTPADSLPGTATINVNPPQTQTYTLTVTDTCGTPFNPANITVIVESNNPITATISIPDTIICDATVTFSATATGGQNALHYLWSTGDTVQTLTVTPEVTTTYTVTVTDECGNTAGVADVEVSVICEIIAPNVFTPNGDGINETLVFEGLELYPESKLYIFNRWGRKVFESLDYKNNWDGENFSEGVYYFVLDVPAKPDKLHGTVTILRNNN